MLFQPLEETLRTILSKLLAAPTPFLLEQSSVLILSLLKLHILLALLIHAIVPPLASDLAVPVLNILLGKSQFPSAALIPILSAYLYYIPIMAVNGILESFIASVATTSDLVRQSRAMLVFSVHFLGVSWGLLRGFGLGGEGLVWGNCINLGMRIVWSWRFIRNWFTTRKINVRWMSILPSRGTLMSCVIIGVVIRFISSTGVNGFFETVGVASLGGLALGICMYSLTFPS